jgi:translation initiation factor IF-2
MKKSRLLKKLSNKMISKKQTKQKPPVVVVLGHIDHGKTSILDYIKKTHVQEKETGGITQHIGAYQIERDGKKITFIDTPGHEAFSAIRSRGAKVADIAILVIDAAEGVKTQTKEAITHIKSASLPFIVALNKIDKPGADPQRVKQSLLKEEIVVEDLGGNVPVITLSAKTGQGVSELLDLIFLVAEMEKIEADFSTLAVGTVIESFLDSQRGPIATMIVSEGTFKKGDIVASPSAIGKIKKLEDFRGKELLQAEPAAPVVVLGLEQVPKIGEDLKVFLDMESAEKQVQKIDTKKVLEVRKNEEGAKDQRALNLIIKTDVNGSLEAIEQMLAAIPQDRINIKILKSEVGEINESDLKLARDFKALIIGFRIKINQTAAVFLEREKIRIIRADIIYELIEGVRKTMERMLAPKEVRTDLGKIKVLIVFMTDKNRQIVGGKITNGEVEKGARLEVYRNEELIGKGRIVNLQRNKKDMPKLSKGDECGILYEGTGRIEKGDEIIAYKEERQREIL